MDFEEEEEEKPAKVTTSECPICFETLPSKTAVKRHHSKVHKVQTFKCGKCGRIFSKFNILLRHYTKFHEMVVDPKTIYTECLVR